ncbi:e3 ubiquitin-protein ligase-like protein [Stemphylium lycopersici]|nr:e3 ubiquitin-protein ligase-like protein [Stemphylium lycopersici]RAR00551.1 e3 ubiquitin-protein ligase-like protein [Stemphylium lycopersici]
MADLVWDQTAPIFDDAVYLAEALRLPINQNEDDLDAELALQARESGIHDPYRFVPPPKTISRAISTMTLDSDQRSSRSIHSQETQSTSFTSAPSRTSRDHVYSTDHPTAKRAPPTLTRPSHSLDNCQKAIDCPESGIRSRQSSTLSVAPSVISTASSSQQAQPRKKRASAIFSLFRRDSSACLSASHQTSHSKPSVAKLDCGHSLSTHDIRKRIQEALQRGTDAAPDCCGSALPPSVLEHVLTKEEADLVADGVAQASIEPPLRDSGYCEPEPEPVDPSPPHNGSSASVQSPTRSDIPPRRPRHEAISIDAALANEAFKSFKSQQKEQFERVSTFESTQRKALSAHYKHEIERLKAQHEIRKTQRIEQHTDNLDRLEERQLLAEHDLLETQAQETQNVATALKYIEAYCLGAKSQQEHTHTVSVDDFKKLERQKLLQQSLPRKHTSAINVLRARQELDLKRRLETHEAELKQLDVDLEKEESTKEEEYRKELEQLEKVIEARRTRLLQRWELKFEIWRRDWEQQHDTTMDAKLEHEDWPPRPAEHTITIPDASALAQYVKVAT